MSLADMNERPSPRLDVMLPSPGGRIGTPIDFRQLARRVSSSTFPPAAATQAPAAVQAPAVAPQAPAAAEAPAAAPQAPAAAEVPALLPLAIHAPVELQAQPQAPLSSMPPTAEEADAPVIMPAAAPQPVAMLAPEPEPDPEPLASIPAAVVAEARPASFNRPPRADLALALLSEVAQVMQTLMARCQKLEASAATTNDRAQADLDAAHASAVAWQLKAIAMQEQMERMEQDAAALLRRTAEAEEEAAAALSLVDSSQKAAAEAECLSSLFSDKVISSFGAGSPGHSILETVRNRTQQLLDA